MTGEDGRRVVALFQAIYQSNREGRSIRLRVDVHPDQCPVVSVLDNVAELGMWQCQPGLTSNS